MVVSKYHTAIHIDNNDVENHNLHDKCQYNLHHIFKITIFDNAYFTVTKQNEYWV